jgi:hypothetical protein
MSVDNDWNAAKKIKGFNPWQTRYYANVLDRTPVKVSSSGEEVKQRPDGTYPQASSNGELITDVEETVSNTVKILSGGKTLFGDLEMHDSAILDQAENPIGIHNYDVVLMVKGEGRERQVTPVPQVGRDDEIDLEEYELYDLDRALISFTPEEITSFLSGVSLSDIFKARRATASLEVDEDRNDEIFQEDTEEDEKLSKDIKEMLE